MCAEETSTSFRSWLERIGQALSRAPQDSKDLKMLLKAVQDNDVISKDTFRMIEGVLNVSNMQVRDIMVPRAQMIVISATSSLQKLLPIVIESRHSRFPVIEDSRDEVIGILLAKDLLEINLLQETNLLNLKTLVRPAKFVPESKRLDILLKEFRVTRHHMAMVADEYGGVAGLVTIEDVLEQIVGDIEDEHDVDEEQLIKQQPDGSAVIKGYTPIAAFNEAFKTHFSDEEFDTIGGIVTKSFGRLPKRDEKATIQDIEFKILRADKRRIRLLQVKSVAAK